MNVEIAVCSRKELLAVEADCDLTPRRMIGTCKDRNMSLQATRERTNRKGDAVLVKSEVTDPRIPSREVRLVSATGRTSHLPDNIAGPFSPT